MMTQKLTPEAASFRKPEHEVLPLFLNRWSPRSFQDKPVPDELVLQAFEAARWAPSSGNGQPWRYVIARTQEDREKFLTFVNESNVEWCRKAPVLAVVFAGQVTPHGNVNRWGGFDAGASWGYLALHATALGLHAHAMGGFDKEKAKATLQAPDDYEAMAVIALGYRGDKDQLSERNREREQPSSRKPLADTLFEGAFGRSVQ